MLNFNEDENTLGGGQGAPSGSSDIVWDNQVDQSLVGNPLESGGQEGFDSAPAQEGPSLFGGLSEAGSHAVESVAGGWNAWQAELAKRYGEEEHGRYSERALALNTQKLSDMESRMGLGSQVVSGVIQSAPSMAAMLSPVGIAAKLGGVALTSYGQNMGNVLLEQERTGYGRNLDEAENAAGMMTAVDMGLSMLPTGSAAKIGRKVLAESGVGAASGMQQRAFTNLATGKDWDDNIVLDGAIGGITGGIVSGSMIGINKAMGVPMNQAGKNASNEVRSLGADINIDQNFQRNYVEYKNLSEDLNRRIMEAPAGSKEQVEALAARANLDRQGVTEASLVKAAELLRRSGVKLDDGYYDFTVNDYKGDRPKGNAADIIGVGSAKAQRANQVTQRAHASFGTRTSATNKGLTRSAAFAEMQVGVNKAIGDGVGAIRGNIDMVDRELTKLKLQKNEASKGLAELPSDTRMKDLALLMHTLEEANKKYSAYLTNKKVSDFEGLEETSTMATKLAAELGYLNQFKGIDGKPGSFDLIEGITTIDTMYKMAKAKYPGFEMGTPDKISEAVRDSITPGDVARTVGTAGLNLAAKPFIAKHSQNRLQKQLEKGDTLSKMTKGLNEAAAQAKANSEILKAQAASNKASNDAVIAEAKIAEAQAKADATAAKLAEKEAKDQAKAEQDAAKREAEISSARAAAEMGDSLAANGLEGGTATAENALVSSGINITPEPLPSIFASDVTLAGATRRPENFFKPTKSEEEVSNAQAKAEQDSQAVIEAAQRVEQLKAMATQPKQLESPTGIPAKPTKEELDIIEAQQRADLAAQQAEQSRRNAEMLAHKQAANSALVQQQNALARADEQKRAQAEEQARQEAEALAAQQPVVEQAPKERVPVPKIKKTEEVVEAESNLEAAQKADAELQEKLDKANAWLAEKKAKTEDSVALAEMTSRQRKSAEEATKRARERVEKLEAQKKAALEEVEKAKERVDLVTQPKAPKKPVEETSPEVEPTAPPKAEEPTQAAPETPRVHSFDLARRKTNEEIAALRNTKTSDMTPEISRKIDRLETKAHKTQKAFKKFTESQGHKYSLDDIKTAFGRFTDAELMSGVNNTDVSNKLRALRKEQEAETIEMFKDSDPVEVVPETVAPKKTPEQVKQEKIENEWKTVDVLAEKYGVTGKVEDAIAALGTDRYRPVRAETVVRKAIQLSRPSDVPTDGAAPNTYDKQGAKEALEDASNSDFLKDILPAGTVDKIFGRYFDKLLGPIPDKRVQDAVSSLYSIGEAEVLAKQKKAKEDLAILEGLDKKRLEADQRAKVIAEIKQKTEAYNKLLAQRKELADAKAEADAQARADKKAAEKRARQEQADAEAREKADKALKELGKIESQKNAARNFLKGKEGVDEARIAEFERDVLDNHTKSFGSDLQMVDYAKKWLKEAEAEAAARPSAIQKEVDRKIAEVEDRISKLLADKEVPNLNVVINQVMEGKTNNIRSAKDTDTTLINKIGTLQATLNSGKKVDADAKKLARATLEAYKFAAVQRKLHPDNPDAWLSKELYENIRDAIVGVGSVSSYFGRLGTVVRSDIFGSDHSRNWFNSEQIQRMNDDITAARDRELDLGDDITVRSKK